MCDSIFVARTAIDLSEAKGDWGRIAASPPQVILALLE